MNNFEEFINNLTILDRQYLAKVYIIDNVNLKIINCSNMSLYCVNCIFQETNFGEPRIDTCKTRFARVYCEYIKTHPEELI